MHRLSRWIAAAALAAMLASPLAAEAASAHQPRESASTASWSVIERWLSPLLRLLAGATPGTLPSSGEPGGNETDAGPHSDPDGLTTGKESDAGPRSDPDGLTAGNEADAGSHGDPNGFTSGNDSDAGPRSDPNG